MEINSIANPADTQDNQTTESVENVETPGVTESVKTESVELSGKPQGMLTKWKRETVNTDGTSRHIGRLDGKEMFTAEVAADGTTTISDMSGNQVASRPGKWGLPLAKRDADATVR